MEVGEGDDGLEVCFFARFDRALEIDEVIESPVVGEFADGEPSATRGILPSEEQEGVHNQFSTLSVGTRENSLRLAVITVRPSVKA